MKLLLGDCLDKLKELDNNSVDSIVTDPPYGLAFMGKHWDYDVPSQQIWEECMRVLKPGGHLLSFAGSRTYHRMAVRIEDAGFEIRDQIMWIYGSGFPKSHNIGKAIDKMEGNEREVVGTKADFSLDGAKRNPTKHREVGEAAKEIQHEYGYKQGWDAPVTKGNSEWEGWGTALKPAHEPIVMARKPFKGTVAYNVLEWGTGGINVDGCRIGTNETITNHSRSAKSAISKGKYGDSSEQETHQTEGQLLGRFPANVIFDEEAGRLLDEQSGVSKSSGGSGDKSMGALGKNGKYGNYALDVKAANLGGLGDVGGASRFFYCPKTSKTDRNEGLDGFDKKVTRRDDGQPYGMNTNKFRPDGSERKQVEAKQNHHPTVKPVDLMLYLIRLVTPKGGVTLDPFMGSGSSGKAAVRGGFDFIGIEREQEYFEISEARIQYEIDNPYKEETKTKTEVKKEVVDEFFRF